MKCLRIILFITLTIGCRHVEAFKFTGPDGVVYNEISCKKELGPCYRIASKMCPYGYKVLSKEDAQKVFGEHQGESDGNNSSTHRIIIGGQEQRTSYYKIIIFCK